MNWTYDNDATLKFVDDWEDCLGSNALPSIPSLKFHVYFVDSEFGEASSEKFKDE